MPGNWKRLDQLVPADLAQTPVWAHTFRGRAVGPNDGLVRPTRPKEEPDAMIVRTRFRLADGTTELGYCFPIHAGALELSGPPGEYDRAIAWTHPAILTRGGPVPFWLSVDERPVVDDVALYYARLGRTEAVFPIEFAADVPLASAEIAAGVITGFHFVVYDGIDFEVDTIA